VTLGTKTMFLKNVDAEHKVSSNLLTNQLLLFGGRREPHSAHYELQASHICLTPKRVWWPLQYTMN